MKTTWIICQKQLSKGYFKSRGWRKDRKPRFTKQITTCKRFATKADAEAGKALFIADMDRQIAECTNKISIGEQLRTKVYSCLNDFVKDLNKTGFGYTGRFYGNGRTDPWNIGDENAKLTTINQGIEAFKQTIFGLNNEKEYYEKKLFIREVPMGLRFANIAKPKVVEFVKNDCNNYCCNCGGDIPDVIYMQFGYGSKLCVMCLSEFLPDINKHIKEMSQEVKQVWSQERFLKDLD